MRNTLKTLGILCIIAATVFIAACGDLPEAENVYTVKFDSDGGSFVSPITVPADGTGTVTKPNDPTKNDLTDPGLYKNFTGYTFGGWELNGAPYSFGTPVDSDITLKAKWTLRGEKVTLSGTGDVVTQAFAAINAATIAAGDKYILYINADVNPVAAALTLTKANANLTITSDRERDIKSPNLSTVTGKVFLTVGVASGQNTSISLTLKNVAVVGSGTPTGDSLIRVRNGASLILDNKATVEKHINNVGTTSATTSNGDNGNGSAICVINGGNLTIKTGAVIQENKSTGNQNNKNLVGGIYAIGTASTKSVINIEGGDISGNESTDGNTADIYITETVELHIKGNLTIGELAINSDDGKYPDFRIDGRVTNKIKKFNLRSTTGTLKTVQDAWTATNAKVFSGTADYVITLTDVAQFELWEFTGNTSLRGTGAKPDAPETWANLISPTYEIVLVDKSGTTPNYGKLVKATP